MSARNSPAGVAETPAGFLFLNRRFDARGGDLCAHIKKMSFDIDSQNCQAIVTPPSALALVREFMSVAEPQAKNRARSRQKKLW
jgi:hypothetical protein